MRLALFLIWAAIAVAVLWPLVWPKPVRRQPLDHPIDDELVKDPVCQTYVLRSRSVQRMTGVGPRYFCSAECARRYVTEIRG